MIGKAMNVLAAALVMAGPAAAQESTSFILPVPDGWRTETIAFPLDFAPDLPYTGIEELRFAPGMLEEGGGEFWSYAFIWWVPLDRANDPASLAGHLATYFHGLAASVAAARQFELGEVTFDASLEPVAGGFAGSARMFDPFVTRGPLELNVRGTVLPCPHLNRQAIFFAFSPRAFDSPVWAALESIRSGFRCGLARQ